jgi:uncharacterized DUF497 family protein
MAGGGWDSPSAFDPGSGILRAAGGGGKGRVYVSRSSLAESRDVYFPGHANSCIINLMDFRWNEWNSHHIATHGVSRDEAEAVVRRAKRPFPRRIEDDKWLAWGAGNGGRLLQVVFVVDEGEAIFVIHARPLTDKEKRRYRRSKS